VLILFPNNVFRFPDNVPVGTQFVTNIVVI
jgi:hypothetical protein